MRVKFILAVDIVAYSLLPTALQTKVVSELGDALEACPSYVAALQAGKVIKCPTGDGFILAFDDPEPALETGTQLQDLMDQSESIQIRSAIHFGACETVVRSGEPDNIAGEAPNYACRAMGAAQPGDLVLTDRAFSLYSEFSDYHDRLVDYGVQNIKHGKQLKLYKLVSEQRPKPKERWERYREEAKMLRARAEIRGSHRLASDEVVAKRLEANRRDKIIGGIGVLVAAGSGVWLESSSTLKPTETELLSAIQVQAVSPPKLNVRVIDIGSGYNVKGSDQTNLVALQDLLQIVLKSKPKAVAIDIDFSRADADGHLLDEKESVLAPALQSSNAGTPVFLAVDDGLSRSPEEWLGDARYLPLAAHPEGPKDEVGGRRTMIGPLLTKGTKIPSLADGLASALLGSRPLPAPNWVTTPIDSPFRFDLNGEAAMTGNRYLLNSSALSQLKASRIDLSDGRRPTDQECSQMVGEAIVIGSSAVQSDVWPVLGEPDKSEGGLYLHAVSAVTLAQTPLVLLRPWTRFVVNLLVGAAFLATVLDVRRRNLTAVDSVAEGRIVVLVLFGFATIELLICSWLVRTFGIVWNSFLFLPFLLLLHPRIRGAIETLVSQLRRQGEVIWRKLALAS
jgi:class 3 adenylate cyclase